MTLLREIQQAATTPDSDIAALLRKCKILAFRLKNEEFKRWIENELNGYDDPDSLPAYRKMTVNSVGHFSGPFGSGMKNVPLPIGNLPEIAREDLGYAYLTQPITAYSALLTGSSDGNPREPWPAEIVAICADQFMSGMNLISAWKVIPRNGLAGLIDTIRTRILNFCLEIESLDPDAGESESSAPPISQERITQNFYTTITGSVQNVATGGHMVTQTASVTESMSAEIIQALIDAIDRVAAETEGVSEVRLAAKELRESQGTASFGQKYKTFMSTLADHAQVLSVIAPYLPPLAALVHKAMGG